MVTNGAPFSSATGTSFRNSALTSLGNSKRSGLTTKAGKDRHKVLPGTCCITAVKLLSKLLASNLP
jgi:hypothetical protein